MGGGIVRRGLSGGRRRLSGGKRTGEGEVGQGMRLEVGYDSAGSVQAMVVVRV